MNNKLTVILVIVLIIRSTTGCVFDYECTVNGLQNRCVNGRCLVSVECTRDIDCRYRGIYFKCVNARCVASDHKTCLTNDDCKKNKLHKKCVNSHCVFKLL
jgi:hypothetical protein